MVCGKLSAKLRKLRDRSFFTREGGLVGFGGGPCEKKRLSRGGHPKKIREKGGPREIF